jgi:hypothetical protein
VYRFRSDFFVKHKGLTLEIDCTSSLEEVFRNLFEKLEIKCIKCSSNNKFECYNSIEIFNNDLEILKVTQKFCRCGLASSTKYNLEVYQFLN